MIDKDILVEICANFKLAVPKDANIALNIPYIPFIPDSWNGILVLSEAQNLAASSIKYLDWLKGLSTTEQIHRLEIRQQYFKELGIGPWDYGYIKLAVAALGGNVDRTAVSNFVLWSKVVGNHNVNPDKYLQEKSIEIWDRLLVVLQGALKGLILCGSMAHFVESRIIKDHGWNIPTLKLCLPVDMNLNRLVGKYNGFFSVTDLVKRYNEVYNAWESNKEHFNLTDVGRQRYMNAFAFACHAISRNNCSPNRIRFSEE